MASPVDTSVKFFHSGMAGAPVLSGTAGSGIAILDACLVDGFGLKSVDTLVVSSNVATVNVSTGHSAEVGTVILVAGATPAALNGEQKVTAVGANTVSFATEGLSDQTATGTITFKIAPAGWAKAFAGTNTAAYRSQSVESPKPYLRVDDTAAGYMKVVGYESMSDINTGVAPFPSVAQRATGLWWSKSNQANTSAREWILVGDGRLFYFSRANSITASPASELDAFGDTLSVKSGDAYAAMLSGRPSDTSASGPTDNSLWASTYGSAAVLYLARSYTGIGGSCLMRKTFAQLCAGGTAATTSGADSGFPPYPHPLDGALYVTPLNLIEHITLVFRATAPGFYCVPQNVPFGTFAARDTVEGVNGLPGRVLRMLPAGVAAASITPSFVDTTGPWR